MTLIESLSDIANFYGEQFDAHIEGRELPEARVEELSAHWELSQRKVQRARHLGAFMFSEEVDVALTEFFRTKSQRQESYFECLDHGYAVTKRCLDAVAAASRSDLQLRGLDLPWGARAQHNKWLQRTREDAGR